MDYKRFLEVTDEYAISCLKGEFRSMSNLEIFGIEHYIKEWFEDKGIYNIGLETAYSSSSQYPMLNVMEDIKYNEMQLSHICLANTEAVVLVFEDENEDYRYFYIS
ncbi:hypothetical protein CPT_Stills107 [Bacillus phage Stills]|uniref:Uncharacterized protein n=1 Tax=Bacillus phage Stills TaxID=1610833 RepID=A0A0E3T7R7_9CAUD|nr:hypothetical protein CPT_Stills107 [Bacillus phage Stills]AKC02735.1 hypothetical protein CPT_Stills107 [Bacillus phage Stills]